MFPHKKSYALHIGVNMHHLTAMVLLSCTVTLAACTDQKPTATDNNISTQSSSIADTSNSTDKRSSMISIDPSSLAIMSPRKYQPAASADASGTLVSNLLSEHKQACDVRNGPAFFSLFTERVRFGFSKQSKEQLMKYFSDSCESFPSLAAQLADGVTISQDSYSTEDGEHISKMCPIDANGVCRSGIAVGIEDGKLKFSEW